MQYYAKEKTADKLQKINRLFYMLTSCNNRQLLSHAAHLASQLL